jgi:mannose-6-phosphate isomerase
LITETVGPIWIMPRLDVKPWGGRSLEQCGIALPAGVTIGEALLTAPESTVISGPLAGLTLEELARTAPDLWVGERGLEATGGRSIFPLLVKLIDASADLSIQVHPDDAAALAAGLGTGKTEAWHVVAAHPGSVLYAGLVAGSSADDFAAACRRADGSAVRYLRQIPAEAGMTLLIPAGTPHAIGAGVTLYEIQQPSNVTFRLDDWGRVDAAGNSRDLHHADGLPLVDARLQPNPIALIPLHAGPSRRDLLTATRYFALERLVVHPGDPLEVTPANSPQVLTYLSGDATVQEAGGRAIPAGETQVLPAGAGATIASANPCTILRGWVPDLDAEIVAVAVASGASPSAIQQLGLAVGNDR